MREGWDRISELWCIHMHAAPMWPAHGRYECRNCHRIYPVEWASGPFRVTAPSAKLVGRQQKPLAAAAAATGTRG